jgi:hypothetical protein
MLQVNKSSLSNIYLIFFFIELVPLDLGRLVSPLDVEVFPILDDEPPFCAEEGWMDACFAELQAGMNSQETNLSRVQPMALIRCSRGGKTRALLELKKLFHQRVPNIAVIYVSFNDFSSLESWELRDPIAALCRRIAFSALRERNATREGFKVFNRTLVLEYDIINWLGDIPCLLLIDELNVMELDHFGAPLMAAFLKETFLYQRGRYFAFSSHVLPSGHGLADFMDSISERGIIIRQLPLIPSMADARNKFQWPDLTVRQALFRGRVPALISYTRGRVPPPFDKRKGVVDLLFHTWDDAKVMELLSSFLSGEAFAVPEPLLQLMSVSPVEGQGKIIWIPYHMIHVLQSIMDIATLSPMIREVVQIICDMFHGFETGKVSGGDSWEALFVISAIVRVATGHFCSLLPLDIVSFANSRVSYNYLWNQKQAAADFSHITTMEQLIDGLTPPPSYPHVAVFYPPHARFEMYDLLVVTYLRADFREIYGYQLKEGRVIPKKEASDLCQHSYVIRGFATEREELLRGWKVASDEEIDQFLGVTGVCLTPKKWRSLEA